MFNKHTGLCLILWSAAVLCLGFYFEGLSSASPDAYRDLVLKKISDQDQSKEKESFQTRQGVSKQVLYTQNKERLQTRLRSDGSEIVYRTVGHQTSLEERFQNMTCEMQEKIYTLGSEPRQIIRKLEGQGASYFYQTGLLETERVDFSRRMLPGNEWPKPDETGDILFKGYAKKVQLRLFKEPTFHAQGLQATFFGWGEGE